MGKNVFHSGALFYEWPYKACLDSPKPPFKTSKPPFVSQQPIISVELAAPVAMMRVIKEEYVGISEKQLGVGGSRR